MDSQPELFAQHYAEAGLVEKSVACWGKAGQRSAARSAMAEAAAQFQKGLDQLALLPDSPERQRQELEFCDALGAVLRTVKGFAAPETGQRLRPSAESCGSSWVVLRNSLNPSGTIDLSRAPGRIRSGAALGRGCCCV